MKIIVLYRPDSEHARATEMFMRDFQVRNPGIIPTAINIDDREGVAMCRLYGIMRYPAILALTGDGSLLKLWEGDSLPLMDEVASYAVSG